MKLESIWGDFHTKLKFENVSAKWGGMSFCLSLNLWRSSWKGCNFEIKHITSSWGGWGCEVSCGGHHRLRGKTTTGSALDGAVFDITQILAYLVHNMSRSQLYLGFGHFGWLPFFVNSILAGLWLNCISSVEITLFLLADILLQHRALFQC